MTILAKFRWLISVPQFSELAIIGAIETFHQPLIKDTSKIQFFGEWLGTTGCRIPIPGNIKM
jgi:hypothetical protein